MIRTWNRAPAGLGHLNALPSLPLLPRSLVSPVLLIGAPRSGTTWASRVLGLTYGASLVHEPDNERRDPFALSAKRKLGLFPALQPGDVVPTKYEQLWQRVLEDNRPRAAWRWMAAKCLLNQADCEELRRALDGDDSAWTPRLQRVVDLVEPCRGASAGGRRVVKSVHAVLAAEWLASRFRPTVVAIMRNPLNVAASYLGLGWQPDRLDHHIPNIRRVAPWAPPYPPDASMLVRLGWQIGLFTAVLERGAAAHPDWVLVRHETLCRAPEAAFSSLAERLDLRMTRDAVRFLQRSDRPGSGMATRREAAGERERWRQRLTASQIAELESVLVQFPDAWPYDPEAGAVA
jgi:hypothetical protein